MHKGRMKTSSREISEDEWRLHAWAGCMATFITWLGNSRCELSLLCWGFSPGRRCKTRASPVSCIVSSAYQMRVFLRETSPHHSRELWVAILPPKPLTGCIDDYCGDLWAEHTSVTYKQCAEAVVVQTPDPTHWLWSQSVTPLCPTLCDPMDYSTPGLPVLHCLLVFAETHVIESIMLSNYPILCHPLIFLPQSFQGLFQWISSLHQVAKVLELQLQHQSFQWIFRVDFL